MREEHIEGRQQLCFEVASEGIAEEKLQRSVSSNMIPKGTNPQESVVSLSLEPGLVKHLNARMGFAMRDAPRLDSSPTEFH